MSRVIRWFTFEDRGPACALADSEEEARALADAAGAVKTVDRLPYPAQPRLDQLDGWCEGEIPSFCWAPSTCKGRSSCPRNPCCTS